MQKAKDEKVEVTDNDVNADVDRRMQTIRSRFTTEKEFRDELKKSGFGTVDEFRRWLSDQSRDAASCSRSFSKSSAPTARSRRRPSSTAEVNEFFNKNSSQLKKLPATVTLRQIVVSPKPSPHQDSVAVLKAESLYVEIKKGGNFEQIAKRESMDPGTKELGGDLGWHRRGDFVPEFDRVYFGMRPGVVSPPFKTVFGYHLIRVDRVQPAEVKGRHILIRPTIDSADIAKARAEAFDSRQGVARGRRLRLVAHEASRSVRGVVDPAAVPQDSCRRSTKRQSGDTRRTTSSIRSRSRTKRAGRPSTSSCRSRRSWASTSPRWPTGARRFAISWRRRRRFAAIWTVCAKTATCPSASDPCASTSRSSGSSS